MPIVLDGTTGITSPSLSTPDFLTTNSLGMRNRIINGAIVLDQRNSGASQTITAGAALAYTVDRWYAYCTGANVTGQQVAGSGFNLFAYRFTGAASVTAIGFGQRIESFNSADMAGTTATLSVELANTLLTTVTWTAFYANTTDTFGTLASPAKTQIATGSFTVSSTLDRYTTQIIIPGAATTGIEIVFTVGAQTSGTWTIDNVQLEPGTVSTPFERRQIGQELALCQRYYEVRTAYSVTKGAQYDGNAWIFVPQYTTKRVIPTITCTSTFANPSSRRTTTAAVMTSANALDGATVFIDAEMRD
jgi:hypothetical protein